MKYARLNGIKPHFLGQYLDVIVNTRLLNNSIYDIADEIDYPSLLKKNPLSRIPNGFRKYSIFCTWVAETTNLSNGIVDLTQLLPDYIYQSEQYCPKNSRDRKNALCSSNIINEHICVQTDLENFCDSQESVLKLKSNIRDYQSNLENLCNLMDVILFGQETFSKMYENIASWSKDPTITLLLILKVIVPVNAVHKDVDDEVLCNSYRRLYYFLLYYTSRDNGYDNSFLIEEFKINLIDRTQNYPVHLQPYPRIYSLYFTKKIIEDYIRYKQSFVELGIESPKTFPKKLEGVFEGFLCDGYPTRLRFNPQMQKYYSGYIIHFEEIDGFVLLHKDVINKCSKTIRRETYLCEFGVNISQFKIRPLASFNKRDAAGALFEFIPENGGQPKIAAAIYDGGLLEGCLNGFERIDDKNEQTNIRRYQESYYVNCQHFSSESPKQIIISKNDEITFKIEKRNIWLKVNLSEFPFLRTFSYDDKCYYIQFGPKGDEIQKQYLYFPRFGITLDEGQFIKYR